MTAPTIIIDPHRGERLECHTADVAAYATAAGWCQMPPPGDAAKVSHRAGGPVARQLRALVDGFLSAAGQTCVICDGGRVGWLLWPAESTLAHLRSVAPAMGWTVETMAPPFAGEWFASHANRAQALDRVTRDGGDHFIDGGRMAPTPPARPAPSPTPIVLRCRVCGADIAELLHDATAADIDRARIAAGAPARDVCSTSCQLRAPRPASPPLDAARVMIESQAAINRAREVLAAKKATPPTVTKPATMRSDATRPRASR